jgi:hypothetical protein
MICFFQQNSYSPTNAESDLYLNTDNTTRPMKNYNLLIVPTYSGMPRIPLITRLHQPSIPINYPHTKNGTAQEIPNRHTTTPALTIIPLGDNCLLRMVMPHYYGPYMATGNSYFQQRSPSSVERTGWKRG